MGLQEYDPHLRAKDAVVPFASKMDFWNAKQTQCFEIQEVALPGRRDSREARREPDASEFLGGTCTPCPVPPSEHVGDRGIPREVLGNPDVEGPSPPGGPGQWGAGWRSCREDLLVAPVWNILFPQVFSPVLQDSSQMFPLWEDHLPPSLGSLTPLLGVSLSPLHSTVINKSRVPLFPSWLMSSPGRDRVSRHHCVSVIRTGGSWVPSAPSSALPNLSRFY